MRNGAYRREQKEWVSPAARVGPRWQCCQSQSRDRSRGSPWKLGGSCSHFLSWQEVLWGKLEVYLFTDPWTYFISVFYPVIFPPDTCRTPPGLIRRANNREPGGVISNQPEVTFPTLSLN